MPGKKCPDPQDGDPLPDHYQIVRVPVKPGQEAFQFKPKSGETTIHKVNATGKKEEGFSVLAPPSDAQNPLTAQQAAQAAKDEFYQGIGVKKKEVFTVSAKELRDNGFDVVKDSSGSLPSHATIIKKGGGKWDPKDSKDLENLFGKTKKVK
jgi:hypothetical protein